MVIVILHFSAGSWVSQKKKKKKKKPNQANEEAIFNPLANQKKDSLRIEI